MARAASAAAPAAPIRLASTERPTIALTVDVDQLVGLVAQRLEEHLISRLATLSDTRPSKAAYRVPEAAASLSISERECWDLVGSGELASVTIGRMRLIPASAISDFLNAKLAAERAS